jgi:hypothetical protein
MLSHIKGYGVTLGIRSWVSIVIPQLPRFAAGSAEILAGSSKDLAPVPSAVLIRVHFPRP